MIRSHNNQIKLVAELLLEKETINHDDLVSLIGARPFKAHKSYLEFISANEDAKQKMADGASEKDGEGESATAGGGGDAEGEGSAPSKAGDSGSATQEEEEGAGGSSSGGASGSKEP